MSGVMKAQYNLPSVLLVQFRVALHYFYATVYQFDSFRGGKTLGKKLLWVNRNVWKQEQ